MILINTMIVMLNKYYILTKKINNFQGSISAGSKVVSEEFRENNTIRVKDVTGRIWIVHRSDLKEINGK